MVHPQDDDGLRGSGRLGCPCGRGTTALLTILLPFWPALAVLAVVLVVRLYLCIGQIEHRSGFDMWVQDDRPEPPSLWRQSWDAVRIERVR